MQYKKQICELLDSSDESNQKIGVAQALNFGWDIRDVVEYVLNKKYPFEIDFKTCYAHEKFFLDQRIRFAGQNILFCITVNRDDKVIEQFCFMGINKKIYFSVTPSENEYLAMLDFIGFHLCN